MTATLKSRPLSRDAIIEALRLRYAKYGSTENLPAYEAQRIADALEMAGLVVVKVRKSA